LRRINGLLPEDVRMLTLAEAPADFDARFSVASRRYCYRVADGREVDPLQRRFVVGWPQQLDLDSMNSAAAQLVGENDFAAFCRHRPEASTVRTLLHLHWHRAPDGVATMSIAADAFCHSMVRALAGALLPVGSGRRSPDWPAAVLAAGRRIPEVVVMPARGLVLEQVRYPDDVAAQAVVARRVRGPTVNRVG
jgi:tRNA pseudouridine38-40 synthase